MLLPSLLCAASRGCADPELTHPHPKHIPVLPMGVLLALTAKRKPNCTGNPSTAHRRAYTHAELNALHGEGAVVHLNKQTQSQGTNQGSQ